MSFFNWRVGVACLIGFFGAYSRDWLQDWIKTILIILTLVFIIWGAATEDQDDINVASGETEGKE